MVEEKRNAVWKGSLILLAGVVIIIAVAAYLILNPDILKDLAYVALIIVAAVVAVVLIIFAAMLILAVPMYAYKGEKYQDGTSYDLDDVKSVKETSSEEDEKD